MKLNHKQFVLSQGATCQNWQWSWSFINKSKKLIIFGLWDSNKDGLIFSKRWKGNGSNQSIEHIRLIEEEGYKLKIFMMEYGETSTGKPKIKSIEPKLISKILINKKGKWYVADDESSCNMPDEVSQPDIFIEGATKTVSVNIYERDVVARKKCIEHFGCCCAACDFNFETSYGDIGKGFIHVHHIKPLSEIKSEYKVDPIKDLIPLCPNCHAMIHKSKPILTVSKLKKLLSKSKRT